MKYCKSCNLNINDNRKKCPLCQSLLVKKDSSVTVNKFPKVTLKEKKTSFIFKLLLFVTIVSAGICVTINLMVPTRVYWSVFVVAALISMWITLVIAIEKRKNIVKNIIYQTIIISILTVLWDYFTGYHAWAVTYVIPFTFTGAIFTITTIQFILKEGMRKYHIYIFTHIFLGFLPGIFLLFHIVTVKYPAIMCVLISIFILSAMIIFEGKEFLEEIKRRFHM